MLFMEVAHNVWLETNQPMPNTKESDFNCMVALEINQSKDEVKKINNALGYKKGLEAMLEDVDPFEVVEE